MHITSKIIQKNIKTSNCSDSLIPHVVLTIMQRPMVTQCDLLAPIWVLHTLVLIAGVLPHLDWLGSRLQKAHEYLGSCQATIPQVQDLLHQCLYLVSYFFLVISSNNPWTTADFQSYVGELAHGSRRKTTVSPSSCGCPSGRREYIAPGFPV